jgi:hypothetical protein
MSGSVDQDDDDDDIDEAINGAWVNVPSAFSWDGRTLRGGGTSKTVATVGNTVSGVGMSAAQLGTHTSSLAVAGAVAAGAAVSATGLGLVIVGGVLTLGSMATSGTAMVKTTAHVIALKKIRSNLGKFSGCKCMSGARVNSEMAHDHTWIATKVLDYIISQKTEKAVKKGLGTLPGVGLLTSGYRLARYMFKKDRGKKRGYYAYVLTRHLVTHDCALAGAIVGELFSVDEMLTIRMFDTDKSSEVVAKKMKSV